MVPTHHAGKLLPKTKGFFFALLHPDSFSPGGECHKPPNHGIGGILIPPKNGATR